jgi:hypothetical protein
MLFNLEINYNIIMIENKQYSGGINEIPQSDDRKLMWETLKITHLESHSPSITEYINQLKKYYVNGSVKYECFKLGESEVLDWYVSRNQLVELSFFRKLWERPEINMALEIGKINEDSNESFWSSSSSLGESLALVLDKGGAYQKPKWGESKSKQFGEQAALELLDGDRENCLVFESRKAWCDFFCYVAWDVTWVVINKTKRLLHVIMATDTD